MREQQLLSGQCDGKSQAGGSAAPQLPPFITAYNCLVLEFSQHTQPHLVGIEALSGQSYVLAAA